MQWFWYLPGLSSTHLSLLSVEEALHETEGQEVGVLCVGWELELQQCVCVCVCVCVRACVRVYSRQSGWKSHKSKFH